MPTDEERAAFKTDTRDLMFALDSAPERVRRCTTHHACDCLGWMAAQYRKGFDGLDDGMNLSTHREAPSSVPPSAPLDVTVDELLPAMAKVRGAHNGDEPCGWCRLAVEQAVEATRLVRLGRSPDEGVATVETPASPRPRKRGPR